jgi:hypothetical protein
LELSIRLERRLKREVFRLLNGRVSAKSVDPSMDDLARCRRVLVVRVNVRMGNLLLVTPALGALRQAFPHARLDVLCYETYADLLATTPTSTVCSASIVCVTTAAAMSKRRARTSRLASCS